MSWVAMLLALALLTAADPTRVRARVGVGAAPPDRIGAAPAVPADPLAAASSFDVLAACLTSGMAVSTAAAATAPTAPTALAAVLTRAADLLALGADAATAWSSSGSDPDEHIRALRRLARRSASSGAALADGVAELAVESRSAATDAAGATAERASVLIAAPLGLCYLPAFLCLGIVPVVAGLAGDVLQSGVL